MTDVTLLGQNKNGVSRLLAEGAGGVDLILGVQHCRCLQPGDVTQASHWTVVGSAQELEQGSGCVKGQGSTAPECTGGILNLYKPRRRSGEQVVVLVS